MDGKLNFNVWKLSEAGLAHLLCFAPLASYRARVSILAQLDEGYIFLRYKLFNKLWSRYFRALTAKLYQSRQAISCFLTLFLSQTHLFKLMLQTHTTFFS